MVLGHVGSNCTDNTSCEPDGASDVSSDAVRVKAGIDSVKARIQPLRVSYVAGLVRSPLPPPQALQQGTEFKPSSWPELASRDLKQIELTSAKMLSVGHPRIRWRQFVERMLTRPAEWKHAARLIRTPSADTARMRLWSTETKSTFPRTHLLAISGLPFRHVSSTTTMRSVPTDTARTNARKLAVSCVEAGSLRAHHVTAVT